MESNKIKPILKSHTWGRIFTCAATKELQERMVDVLAGGVVAKKSCKCPLVQEDPGGPREVLFCRQAR